MPDQIKVKIVATFERVFLATELADVMGEPPIAPELLVEDVESALKIGHNELADRLWNQVTAGENVSGYEFTVEEY